MNRARFFLIVIAFVGLSFVANAQINLEHTFQGYVFHGTSQLGFATHNYYTDILVTANEIKIYNENYSLYKVIYILPPIGYSISSATAFSQNIVTTDNKVTFFVFFYNSAVEANLRYILKLYDENGVIIKDFGYTGTTSVSLNKTSNNKCRLSIIKYIDDAYKTEIYSLPGNPPKSPTIETTTLPNGIVGKEYNATLTATGDAPITWSLENGTLPNGLNLSSAGLISGIPTETETSNFTVKATNSVGSDKKGFSIFIDEETGISMLQMAEVKIFPNPANDKLIIECENVKKNKIILYDMTGNEILSQNIHGKTEINISNLQKGSYIVSVMSENETIGNFKIVKQ